MFVPFLNCLLASARLTNDFHIGLASNQRDEPFEDHRVIICYEDAYSLHGYEIRPLQNLTHRRLTWRICSLPVDWTVFFQDTAVDRVNVFRTERHRRNIIRLMTFGPRRMFELRSSRPEFDLKRVLVRSWVLATTILGWPSPSLKAAW